jgi:prepilin-type N-terminal cleavage/methylation domain-containing protein
MRVSRRRQSGFSLAELMICVAILGIIASIAIPQYLRFQNKSKASEAKANLKAIRAAEQAYYSEYGSFVAAAQTPPAIPGKQAIPFAPESDGFRELGFEATGRVFFSYAVAVSDSDGSGFTAEAAADLDEDSQVQYWGYVKPRGDGGVVPAVIGCEIGNLTPMHLGPCHPTAGQSVF